MCDEKQRQPTDCYLWALMDPKNLIASRLPEVYLKRIDIAKNRLYVEYFARIEDVIGVHRAFDRA